MIRTVRFVLSQLLGNRKVQTAVAAAAGALSLQLLSRVHTELADETADLEQRVQDRAAELADVHTTLERTARLLIEASMTADRLRWQIERAYAAGFVQDEAEQETDRIAGVGIEVTEPGARARFVEVTGQPCQVEGCGNTWAQSENWSGRSECDEHLDRV